MGKILDTRTGEFVETDPTAGAQAEADRLDREIAMRDLGEEPWLYPDDSTWDLEIRLSVCRSLGAN